MSTTYVDVTGRAAAMAVLDPDVVLRADSHAKIAEIDVIGDPERLGRLDLVELED